MTGPPATILIIDDELRNRRLLEALLRPEGYGRGQGFIARRCT